METRILLKTDIIISEELQDTKFSSKFLSPFGSTLFHLRTRRMVTVRTEKKRFWLKPQWRSSKCWDSFTKSYSAFSLVHTKKKSHTLITSHENSNFFFGFSSISATFSATIFMLKVEFIDSVMIINRFFFDNTSLCPLTKQK